MRILKRALLAELAVNVVGFRYGKRHISARIARRGTQVNSDTRARGQPAISKGARE